jgi:RP/EB family microtubule-associated protein
MQWVKRFWEQNYPGGDYDALGRRKGLGSTPSVGATRSSTTNTASSGRVSSASRKATKTPGRMFSKPKAMLVTYLFDNSYCSQC